jgi:hypothetical protein
MYYLHFKKICPDFEQNASKPRDIKISSADLKRLLIGALKSKTIVDEAYYQRRYPDIKAAIAAGVISSASEHFYETGYFEGRQPAHFVVDEDFYLATNKDVATAMRSGKLKSCQEHFDASGYAEGRLPYANFSLF